MPLGFFSSLPWNVPAAPCDYHRVSPDRLGDTKKGIEKQQEQPGNIIRKEARRQSTPFHIHTKRVVANNRENVLHEMKQEKLRRNPFPLPATSKHLSLQVVVFLVCLYLPWPFLHFTYLAMYQNQKTVPESLPLLPRCDSFPLWTGKKRWWRLKGISGISSSSEIPLVTTMHVRPWKRFSSNRGRGRRKTKTPLVSRSYWTKLNSHCLLVPPHTQLVLLRNERVSDWDTSSRQAWGGSRAAHIVHRPLNVQRLSRKL